jgi:hypothetical protein
LTSKPDTKIDQTIVINSGQRSTQSVMYVHATKKGFLVESASLVRKPIRVSETVVEVVSNLHRNVPYFYNIFWVIKFTLVSALILCLKQPWWSAALAHTITWCMTMPQVSVQVSSSHHGQCHLRLVWAQSIWGATATWSHHHHVFFRFHGEPAIARFAMNMYLYLHWHRRNFCHPPTERPPS